MYHIYKSKIQQFFTLAYDNLNYVVLSLLMIQNIHNTWSLKDTLQKCNVPDPEKELKET